MDFPTNNQTSQNLSPDCCPLKNDLCAILTTSDARPGLSTYDYPRRKDSLNSTTVDTQSADKHSTYLDFQHTATYTKSRDCKLAIDDKNPERNLSCLQEQKPLVDMFSLLNGFINSANQLQRQIKPAPTRARRRSNTKIYRNGSIKSMSKASSSTLVKSVNFDPRIVLSWRQHWRELLTCVDNCFWSLQVMLKRRYMKSPQNSLFPVGSLFAIKHYDSDCPGKWSLYSLTCEWCCMTYLGHGS